MRSPTVRVNRNPTRTFNTLNHVLVSHKVFLPVGGWRFEAYHKKKKNIVNLLLYWARFLWEIISKRRSYVKLMNMCARWVKINKWKSKTINYKVYRCMDVLKLILLFLFDRRIKKERNVLFHIVHSCCRLTWSKNEQPVIIFCEYTL